MEAADFSGYATKAGLKCTDGRTIMPDAFRHQDKMRVPLVWQHGHNDPENVLGHAILENRDDGVYAYGFFNDSAKAVQTKTLVQHGDITMLSIWANQLIERSKQVLHGAIREVSLVLSGANPGALIENVALRHSDTDEVDIIDDEAVIYTGLTLVHGDVEDDVDSSDDSSDEETETEEDVQDEVEENDDNNDTDMEHADMAKDMTIQDVYDSMSEEQLNVLHYMVGEAIASTTEELNKLAQSSLQEGNDMQTNNVFDPEASNKHTLSHDDMKGIVADAVKNGSLKDAVDNYALQHGIENIGELFPDAKLLTNTPELFGRRTEWVNALLGKTRRSPFSRIKTVSADITHDEARAKGYVTGTLKKEEFFAVSKRVTTPTTVYKRQKLDRDDVVDITDFDVVAWLKAEMRLMLDEEIARAILVGDGRDVSHEDKVNEGNIRPIATDHELYTTVVNVNIDDASSSTQEIIDAIIMNRKFYRGTGIPTLFTSETYIAKFLLLKDSLGRRIYKSLEELASELRVSEIVSVEVLEDYSDIIGVIVNPVDYNLGADRGGEINMFDDFDIDYNQHKYLIETRLSGALTKLKSAMVLKKRAGSDTLVVPTAPTFDSETGEVTITNTTGVVYKNGAGTTINAAGSPYSVADGETYTVTATASSGYYFATSEDDVWTFTYYA